MDKKSSGEGVKQEVPQEGNIFDLFKNSNEARVAEANDELGWRWSDNIGEVQRGCLALERTLHFIQNVTVHENLLEDFEQGNSIP